MEEIARSAESADVKEELEAEAQRVVCMFAMRGNAIPPPAQWVTNRRNAARQRALHTLNQSIPANAACARPPASPDRSCGQPERTAVEDW